MVSGTKDSDFSSGGDLTTGDEIVGLRGGNNRRFTLPAILYTFTNLTPVANTIPYYTSGSSMGKLTFLDEDDFASNSAIGVPSQQSVKAYVDTVTAAGVSDGDKGDITVSSSGSVWTIDNNVVTYAKLQNISTTSRILGRITTGAGVAEELTPANVRSIINVEDGATADQTAGEIKTAYESNANTNAFTDSEKTLLGNQSGTNTGDQNLFQTIAVSGQSNVVADSTSDTLTLVAGSNVTITTNAATDTITIAASGSGGIAWSTPVDSSITLDTDSAYDIGTNLVRLKNIYTDAIDVGGNITVGGTVDGRDVASDGTKLDGIESLADVTDTANVTAAGAAMLAAIQTFTAGQIAGETVLTSTAASIAIDLSDSNDFTHTFTENTTLANPTNAVAGQSGAIRLTQHASSPKTLAFGSNWIFAGGEVPTVTATNGAKDTLFYSVRSSTEIECSFVGDWS